MEWEVWRVGRVRGPPGTEQHCPVWYRTLPPFEQAQVGQPRPEKAVRVAWVRSSACRFLPMAAAYSCVDVLWAW